MRVGRREAMVEGEVRDVADRVGVMLCVAEVAK